MNVVKEISDLRECVDRCCATTPFVNYNKPAFRVLCTQCLNEVVDSDSTKAMIKWNKTIRKIKW